jgi:hypothetical protein
MTLSSPTTERSSIDPTPDYPDIHSTKTGHYQQQPEDIRIIRGSG